MAQKLKTPAGASRYTITESGLMVPRNRAARKTQRAYAAATDKQLMFEWITGDQTADGAIRGKLKRLRQMCRDLETDNEAVGRFLFEFVGDVIGPDGFKLESLAADRRETADSIEYEPDEKARTIIEEAWTDFKRAKNFTTQGDIPYCEAKALQERAWVRDGNNLLQIVPGYNNEHGFSVNLMEADVIDTDYSRGPERGAGRVIMGKEFDANGQRIEYFHLLGNHPGEQYYDGGKTRTRVSARGIIHRYFRTRVKQQIGAPLITTAIRSLRHLEKYAEAEVIAARIHASAAIAETKNAEWEDDGEESEYSFTDWEMAPGSKLSGDYGSEFKLLQPGHPNGNFKEFRSAIMQGAAAALLTSYPVLAQDYAGVSYSSIREARISQKKLMRCFRAINVEIEEREIFDAWLISSLRQDKLGLPWNKFEKFRMARFHGAGFEMVDAKKEADGLEKRLQLGVEDPFTAAIEWTGKPLEEVLRSYAKAKSLYEGLEIPLPSWLGGATPADLSAAPEMPEIDTDEDE